MKNKTTILFLGASITQGKISKSYVKILRERLGSDQYKYINHGVAGYESYNVLNKIDKAIRLMPEYVILLIGTNDVLSSLDPRLARISRKLKNIPHEPSLFHFSNNITAIVNQLKKNPDSKIAVASLPVLGENLDSLENKTVVKYNAELKRICDSQNVVYLPVNEKQQKYLKQEIEGGGKDYNNRSKMAYSSMFLHYLLFMSFDNISRKNGFLLLTDGIHQNTLGAKFIADEIEKFIRAG